jgi:hypothetical protein
MKLFILFVYFLGISANPKAIEYANQLIDDSLIATLTTNLFVFPHNTYIYLPSCTDHFKNYFVSNLNDVHTTCKRFLFFVTEKDSEIDHELSKNPYGKITMYDSRCMGDVRERAKNLCPRLSFSGNFQRYPYVLEKQYPLILCDSNFNDGESYYAWYIRYDVVHYTNGIINFDGLLNITGGV